MASIAVFIIAFGVGCLTGAVVGLLQQNPRANDSTRSPLFWPLIADD
jgi:F0F1-type ATP synthase membrane subunit c/vacuolar-type H+-ATPase subunit K